VLTDASITEEIAAFTARDHLVAAIGAVGIETTPEPASIGSTERMLRTTITKTPGTANAPVNVRVTIPATRFSTLEANSPLNFRVALFATHFSTPTASRHSAAACALVFTTSKAHLSLSAATLATKGAFAAEAD